MEPKNEYKTVYFVSAPFANSEEEISTSYIVQDNELDTEDRVIVVNDDGSIVIDDNTTFVDEDGNQIFVNRRSTRVENEEPLAVIKEENETSYAMEITLPNEPQEKSSAEQDESLISSESPNDSSETNEKYADVECETMIVEHNGSSTEGQNEQEKISIVEKKASSKKESEPSTSKPMSILKRKERVSGMSDEDSAACKSIMIFENANESEDEEPPAENVKYPAIPEGVYVDKFTCRYCLKVFTRTCNKLRHIRIVHKVKKNTSSFIRCIECNINYKHVQKLRDHLHTVHKMKMEQQDLNFPNINAFKKWKHEVERDQLTLYTLRHGRRKTPNGHKYFYVCHRAGKYEDRSKGKRQRMLKTSGTCKLGIMCTAAIYCEECPDQINVTYYSHHYGHGKETTFVQLSEVEQNAIQENISNGVSWSNLLGDIRESTTNDHFQVGLIKKKDIKVIKNAFDTEEYNPGLSDAESVDRWVRVCCQMEDSPVLYYRQEERHGSEEEFMLIIMTEFQKHLLLSSEKQILCVDSLHRRKGGRFYLTCLSVLDECEVAFPVAFCISNKVDKTVIKQFLVSIRDSTGPLSCTFFMSDSERFYYEAWTEVMNDESKWLWSMWYVDNRIRVQLRPFKGNVARRADCYRTMRMLLECQNTNVFETMFKNYIDGLHSDPLSKHLGSFIQQRYSSNKELWVYCYHKEIKLSTVIQLEVLHRTLRFCCREGRKKRLDKFIFVIMKLVRFKMLDRLTRILDEEKISLAIDAINMCHSIGLEIPTERISSLDDKIWLVKSDDEEDHVYVVREFDSCPELCALKCSECDICVHMYSCSCMHSMINANLCQHIHAVVWKFLTPHFSPMPSPARDDGEDYEEEIENIDMSAVPSKPSEFVESVLKRTHDVYKKIRSNKCTLKKDSLSAVMKRLDECIDICSGKVVKDALSDSPDKNSMVVINPYVKNSSTQTLILPNQLQTMLPQNKPLSQYVLFLPNNLNNGACDLHYNNK